MTAPLYRNAQLLIYQLLINGAVLPDTFNKCLKHIQDKDLVIKSEKDLLEAERVMRVLEES